MITTLTPNPSFDRTITVEDLVPGAVHRVGTTTTEAGGKGINVARALAAADFDATAVFPASERDGAILSELLDANGHLDTLVIPSDGQTRVNITCLEPDGRTTKLNEPGPQLDADALLNVVRSSAQDGQWFAGCGSLAPGLGHDFYRRMIDVAQATGARVAIDSSGEALKAAVRGAPTLIKPNQHELGELVGATLTTLGHVLEAARSVVGQGVHTVLVSLGADGAILVDREGTELHGITHSTEVRNTVGAGDAFLAGYLAAAVEAESSPSRRLSEALAWGRAAVRSPNTSFSPAGDGDRDAVVINDQPDQNREIQDDG